jgi:methanogenic corrinoid protein MtbC1
MTTHVSAVEEMISRIKSAPGLPADLKIIVGGYPFKVAENLWQRVGADGCAADAMDAVKLAVKLSGA